MADGPVTDMVSGSFLLSTEVVISLLGSYLRGSCLFEGALLRGKKNSPVVSPTLLVFKPPKTDHHGAAVRTEVFRNLC